MRLSKIFSFGLVVLFGSLGVVSANDSFSRVKTYACYHTESVVDWQYVASGNVKDGLKDHKAYIKIRFAAGRDSKKAITGLIATVPLKGMVWDEDFKSVIYNGDPNHAPVVCAQEQWWGQQIYDKTCFLEGKLTNRPDLAPNYCDDEEMSLFSGVVRIRH